MRFSAFGTPLKYASALDHTFVVSDSNLRFTCFGRHDSEDKRKLETTEGFSSHLYCISRSQPDHPDCTTDSDGRFGVIYGIDAVCHQCSNRLLSACSPIRQVYKANGYGLSFLLFGAYGDYWHGLPAPCKDHENDDRKDEIVGPSAGFESMMPDLTNGVSPFGDSDALSTVELGEIYQNLHLDLDRPPSVRGKKCKAREVLELRTVLERLRDPLFMTSSKIDEIIAAKSAFIDSRRSIRSKIVRRQHPKALARDIIELGVHAKQFYNSIGPAALFRIVYRDPDPLLLSKTAATSLFSAVLHEPIPVDLNEFKAPNK